MKVLQLVALLLFGFFITAAQSSDVVLSSGSLQTMDTWKSFVSVCQTMAPYTGVLCSLAPLPTIRQIASDKTTGIMPLLPYSSMIINSFIWVMYGQLTNLKSVFWANSAGFLLGTYYLVVFSRYCGPMSNNNLPGTVEQHLKGTSAIILLNVFLASSLQKNQARDIIGREGVLSFIVLFASPLAALKQVVETKSAATIPLPFTIASVINCLLWSVVGIWQMQDFYIAFPSVMGLMCAVLQLILKAVFGDRVKTEKRSSVLVK